MEGEAMFSRSGLWLRNRWRFFNAYGWSIVWQFVVRRREMIGAIAAFAGIASLASSMSAFADVANMFNYLTAAAALYGLICFVLDMLRRVPVDSFDG